MLRDPTSRGLYVRVWPPHTICCREDLLPFLGNGTGVRDFLCTLVYKLPKTASHILLPGFTDVAPTSSGIQPIHAHCYLTILRNGC